MDPLILTAQILGMTAMVITVLSMQCRSNKNFFLCQETSGILFAVSFFMLGAWSGALMNLFATIRPELLRREKIAQSQWVLVLLSGLLILISLATLLIWKEKWYLILIVAAAQSFGTFFMWTQNGKNIRLAQLGIVSPLWIAYNCLIPVPSIGGILTEIINIISVLLALFRYRKVGFTRK